MYSARDFGRISMVNYLRDMISFVNMVRSDVNWFMGVPSSKKYMRWSKDDFADLERVRLLPILARDGMDRAKWRDGFCGIDHPWFGPRCFKFFYDQRFLAMDVVISQYYTAQSVVRFQAEYSAKYHYMLPKPGLPAVGHAPVGAAALERRQTTGGKPHYTRR